MGAKSLERCKTLMMVFNILFLVKTCGKLLKRSDRFTKKHESEWFGSVLLFLLIPVGNVTTRDN